MPTSNLPASLVSAGLATSENAAEWTAGAIDALGAEGLLEGIYSAQVEIAEAPQENRLHALRIEKMPPYVPKHGAIERFYRLLNTVALIRFEHQAQLRLVEAVIGHLACSDAVPATVVIELQGYLTSNGHMRSRIYRDGVAINSIPRLSQLAPFVKAALWQSAVNAYEFQFYIHAGVVGTGKSCILLPASAGSGKSSLTAALIHDGYQYFSDEVALISRGTYLVPATPLAICSKSTGWDLMLRYRPDLMSLPMHRREDDKLVRYIPPPSHATNLRPGKVSHIIFPCYCAGAISTLERIGLGDALERLMAECISAQEDFTLADAQHLLGWVGQIECYQLFFSSLDEAVALVRRVAPPGS